MQFTFYHSFREVRDRPFDMQGGGMQEFVSLHEVKKIVLHSVNFLSPFPWEL